MLLLLLLLRPRAAPRVMRVLLLLRVLKVRLLAGAYTRPLHSST
jgi:hypothetical protein